MPPRKKTVKKAPARKTRAKVQAPPSPESEPEPEREPEPEPEPVKEASPPAATNTETPAPAATELSAEAAESIRDETLEPQSDAAAETLEKEPQPEAAEETKDSNLIPTETLEPQPDADTAATQTLEKEPEPDAVEENLDAEPAVTEASEEPSESAKKPKTVTRVRKVVKKKIVKKLVPKSAAGTKEESPKAVEEVQKVEEEATVAMNPNEDQQLVEVPSSEDAAVPMETAEEVKKEEDKEEEEAVKATYPKEEQQDVENPNNEDASVPMETVQETATADSEKVEDVTKEEEGGDLEMEVAGNMEAGSSESKSRKKTEIFIGGLDRDAKEEDLRKVFGEVGEIVEVRMIMDGQSGKNKGYAFVRYADASQAKKAVAQFEKVEVCGKLCGASALKGNDTIFLGNIDKKWKKDDIVKLLQEIGIEKIEAVTVMPDSSNADSNRGFAFVELETNKDAVNAYKKLQKKDAFGKGRSIKVDWAEPLDDPDEEEMKKVKSVYAERIPDSWDEEKVRESFKKFGEIERIVLARNIKSSKRKDFAFVNYQTREAALSCIESFDKEELTDNGSKVTVKVSLAKPGQKGKQSKGGPNFSNKNSVKGTPKAFHRNSKTGISFRKGKSSGGGYSSSGHVRSSTNYEPLHASREQPPWRQGQVGYTGGPTMHGYRHGAEWKRPFSSLGNDSSYSDFRGYPRPRVDSFPSTGPSHGGMPHGTAGPPHPYYQRQGAGYPAGAPYGSTEHPATHQMRPGAPPPYGNSYHPRY